MKTPTRPRKPTPKRSGQNSRKSDAGLRLQIVLASAGYGSRRQCEEIITEGRVEVDRKAVTKLGTRVDLEKQEVRVDGTVLKRPKFRYFAVNKPEGVVSTASDPWARLRVIDLIQSDDRVFTVGRLDKESSGLILLTNDGQLANELTHPRYGIPKKYQVVVAGKPSNEALAKVRKGIHLAEGVARARQITIKSVVKGKSTLDIVLTEGRNREIRRMLAKVGHKVHKLKRVAVGPVRLGDIPAGAYRELTQDEVRALRREAKSLAANQASEADNQVPKTGRAPKHTSANSETDRKPTGDSERTKKKPAATDGKSGVRRNESRARTDSSGRPSIGEGRSSARSRIVGGRGSKKSAARNSATKPKKNVSKKTVSKKFADADADAKKPAAAGKRKGTTNRAGGSSRTESTGRPGKSSRPGNRVSVRSGTPKTKGSAAKPPSKAKRPEPIIRMGTVLGGDPGSESEQKTGASSSKPKARRKSVRKGSNKSTQTRRKKRR